MVKYVGSVLSGWKAKCSGACSVFAVCAMFVVCSLEFLTVVFAMLNVCVASGDKPGIRDSNTWTTCYLKHLKCLNMNQISLQNG